MFVTFEGIEGCGKTTQARRAVERLGPRARLTREPGGTASGQSIRHLILHATTPVAPVTEVLLYFADRAQHVAEVVRPALAAGEIVVSDRYLDSSLAYQGYGRGLPLDELRRVAHLATGGLAPDLTVLVDVPVEVGLSRAASRGGSLDRLESERRAFHDRVREGYHRLVAEEPSRWAVVDGQGSIEEVGARVDAVLSSRGLALGERVAG